MFNLNCEYVNLTGSIVISEEASADNVFFVNIYVDNVLVYSNNNITKMTGKIDFDIDVSTGDTLSIEAGRSGGSYFSNTNYYIAITNTKLERAR